VFTTYKSTNSVTNVIGVLEEFASLRRHAKLSEGGGGKVTLEGERGKLLENAAFAFSRWNTLTGMQRGGAGGRGGKP